MVVVVARNVVEVVGPVVVLPKGKVVLVVV